MNSVDLWSPPRMTALSIARASIVGDYELLVVPVAESGEASSDSDKLGLAELPPWVAQAFPDLVSVCADLIVDADFTGKAGSSVTTSPSLSSGAKRVALYGVGKKPFDSDAAEKLAKFTAKASEGVKSINTVAITAPDGLNLPTLKYLLEAGMLGDFKDARFKSSTPTTKPVPNTKFVLPDSFKLDVSDDKMVSDATKVVSGIVLTRQLVFAPPNIVTPAEIANVAGILASSCPSSLSLSVLEEKTCRELGMGSYLAVSQGSSLPPKFIHLKYTGKGQIKKRLAFVGKAITFDSGGINIKTGPGCMIELMKFDMGGSATILGAAKAIAQLELENVVVHFVAPACENMCSGSAYRPGDVVTASNGKTIEVINTDAEGRMALADALVYSESLGVDTIIDVATLTGAAIVALGNDFAPFWSSDDALAAALAEAARATGENLWRMPLVDSYRENLKSEIADMKHTGPRAGGSITASLFLTEFVERTPYAHWDIAGTCWSEKKGGPTGYGVRTLVEIVRAASA